MRGDEAGEAHPTVPLRRPGTGKGSRGGVHKEHKKRRPKSFGDGREARVSGQGAQARRSKGRTMVDMADVLVALEMQRMQQQAAMLAATPPGSRSSFGSLSSWASSGSLAAARASVDAGPLPPPPPYEFQHRKVDSPSTGHNPPLAPPPGFGGSSPAPVRMWLGESRVQPVTPPCEGGSVFDLDSSRGPTSRLSRGEVEQLMQLAGPADLDVPSDHDSMLSSLQRSLEDDHRHVRRGGHTRDQDDDQEEESAFDGVTERQLEQMRLLQVRQHLLVMEERQLADLASGRGLPPPPGFSGGAAPPLAFVGRPSEGHHAEFTLPSYLPAPSAFADVDDSDEDVDECEHERDVDDDDDGDDDDDDDNDLDVDDVLANMLARTA